MVKIISAIGINGEYSFKGGLPWSSNTPAAKSDMKFFRQYTLGKVIIMGYNTWMSLGKPLPNRTNVVINRHVNSVTTDNVHFMTSLEEALVTFPDAIVIGGLKMIREMLTKHIHLVSEIVINRFRSSFEADIYFDIKNIPMIYKTLECEHYQQLEYFWPN